MSDQVRGPTSKVRGAQVGARRDSSPGTRTQDLGPRTQDLGAPSCACGLHDRKASATDPDIKERNLKRLRRIEGQVRGLQKMVDEERYCADVLTQLSSVHEALRGVAREVMRNHLKHCATSAIRSGDAEQRNVSTDLGAHVHARR